MFTWQRQTSLLREKPLTYILICIYVEYFEQVYVTNKQLKLGQQSVLKYLCLSRRTIRGTSSFDIYGRHMVFYDFVYHLDNVASFF